MNKRINWIDIAKGILILLVILGHSEPPTPLHLFINSFHMAGFFMLSGITFKYNDNLKITILKKVKSLLVPYLGFSVLLLTYFFAKSILFDSPFDLTSGVVSIFLPVSGKTSTTVYSLWFLPCLLVTEIIYACVYYLCNKVNKVLGIFVATLTMVICIIVTVVTQKVSVISIVPLAFAMFCLGAFFKDKNVFELDRTKISICLICSGIILCLSIIANYYLTQVLVDLSSVNLGNAPLYILSCISGSLFICTLSILINKSYLFQFFGKNCLYFYGFHYLIIGIAISYLNNFLLATILTIIVLVPVVIVYIKAKNIIIERVKKS